MAVSVSLNEITVHIDASGNVTFTGISNDTVRVGNHQVGVMSFTLDNGFGSPAEFPSNPVEWLSPDGTPIPTPDVFDLQWLKKDHFILTDYNFGATRDTYNFSVQVAVGEQIFSGDPTIINDPPGG